MIARGGVAFGVLELAGVADGGFEAVSGPASAEHRAHQQGEAISVPLAEMGVAGGVVEHRQQREQVARREVAGEQRHQPDQDQRGEADDAKDFLRIGGFGGAVVLQGEGEEQEGGADERDEVDAQREAVADEAQVQQGDMPGVDRGGGGRTGWP